MAMGVLSGAARTMQPQGPAKISAANPLGIVAFVVPGQFQIANELPPVKSGTFNFGVGAAGNAAVGPSTQVPGYIGYDLAPAPAISGDCTIFLYAEGVQAGTFGSALATHNFEVSGSLAGTFFNIGSNGAEASIDGNATANAAGTYTKPTVFAASRIGGTLYFYVNGVFRSSNATGTRIGAITGLTFGRNRAGNNNPNQTRGYAMGLATKGWTAQQHADFAANIWAQLRNQARPLYFVGAGSSGAFTPAITEAATLADTASVVAALSAAASESLPLADTSSIVTGFAPTITEAATLASTQDAVVGYAVLATEAMTLAHTQGTVTGFAVIATDAMTLTDSSTLVFGAATAITESMTLADAASNVATFTASATEAMTLADVPNGSTAGNYTASQTEAMTLADSSSNMAALTASASEALTLTDTSTDQYGATATATDALSLADTTSSSAPGQYSVVIAEAMTLGHTQTVQAAMTAAMTEALALADGSTSAWMTYVALVEALALADSQNGALNTPWAATITEAMALGSSAVAYVGSGLHGYVYIVAAEDRELHISAENRTMTIGADSRALAPTL